MMLPSSFPEAIKDVEVYRQIYKRFLKLLFELKNKELATLAIKEVNMEGLHYYVWTKINPLLEEASKAMAAEPYEMNPEVFYS